MATVADHAATRLRPPQVDAAVAICARLPRRSRVTGRYAVAVDSLRDLAPRPIDGAPNQPSQGGQDRLVWPGQARPGHLAAEYRNFVTQDEDLDVLGRTGAREQLEPAEQPDRDQMQQPEQPGTRSCHDHRPPPKPQVTTIVMSFGTPQGRPDDVRARSGRPSVPGSSKKAAGFGPARCWCSRAVRRSGGRRCRHRRR